VILVAGVGIGLIVELIVKVYLVLYLLPGPHQGLALQKVEQELGQVLLVHLRLEQPQIRHLEGQESSLVQILEKVEVGL
jgi:hypothetical protein